MTTRTRAQLLAAVTPAIVASWTPADLVDLIDSLLLANDPGALLHVDVHVTDAQLRDLVANPITIVAAPGAGLLIDVDHAFVLMDTSAGEYALNGGNPVLAVGTTQGPAFPVDLDDAEMTHGRIAGFTPGRDQSNEPLRLINAIDMTDGDPANYVWLRVYYRIERAVSPDA